LKNGWAIAGASRGEVMVLRRMLAFAMLLSAVSYLGAKTGSIGSVVAHGELRVDGHAVKGSCTAFEGTVVETGSDGQSDADVLLGNGIRITLHSNSHGTLFRDHFVLDRGDAEVYAPATYRVEVDALVVRTTGSSSSARIEIGEGHAIGVFAKEGHVEVAGDRGNVLALIEPRNPRSFSRDAGGIWNVSATSTHTFNMPGGENHGKGNGPDQNRGHHHPHPSH
jgi:hypothetical protein